jgi:hypothetical protein
VSERAIHSTGADITWLRKYTLFQLYTPCRPVAFLPHLFIVRGAYITCE